MEKQKRFGGRNEPIDTPSFLNLVEFIIAGNCCKNRSGGKVGYSLALKP